MEHIDYRTMRSLLDSIGQEAYVTLLVSNQEIQEPRSRTENDIVAKLQVESVLNYKLRDRDLDWVTIYNNITQLLDTSMTLEESLILASKLGLLQEVSILLEAGINPSTRGNAAILSATKENRIDVVSLLLASQLVNPIVDNNSPYRIANRDGFYQLAEVLGEDPRVRSLLT